MVTWGSPISRNPQWSPTKRQVRDAGILRSPALVRVATALVKGSLIGMLVKTKTHITYIHISIMGQFLLLMIYTVYTIF